MRTYLVVLDETEEARAALRFASRRAAKTGGALHLLALVPRQEFVAFGGVQATIAEEAHARAETLVTALAGDVFSESGRMPVIAVRRGEAIRVVTDYLAEHPEVAALVLGAGTDGAPGPLVTWFAGNGIGTLPCPLYIVPPSLDEDRLDDLS
ncbi:universal stress protein [Novosphingobium piscinae]|uniref:Universal stress protein n=1 Tax=Novosphingobium piscinae TaxID=1507448 RepID=A0A7X1KQE5_9SPHN|nr:universal stress protein [Novosphingobium piscinae]MBC2669465.1 universal stress protein [Novosphingobium piscinae]